MLHRLYTNWRQAYQGIPKEIWFLAFVSLVNRCGGMVIAFVTLYLTQALHFSIPDAGYIMMFFGIGSLLGAYIGGRLTDALGSLPVQFWSLVLNGLILICMFYVQGFWMLCLAVFMMALASEIFRPANSVAIAKHCSPENRTRSISLYRMAVNLGWAVAPAFGGLMVALGWGWLFWVDGLTCIAAALMLYILLPPPPVAAASDVPTAVVVSPEELSNSPYRDKKFLWFAVLTCLNVIVFMQLAWTIPVYWKEVFGWSESRIGAVSALNGVIIFLVEMPLVFKLDGRRPPLFYVRIGMLLYGLSYMVFLLPIGFTIAGILFITTISFGEIFAMPFSSNFVFGRSTGAFQGQYMAVYGIAWAIANTIAPLYGTQVIAAWGYNTLWTLLLLQSVVVLLGFWVLERRSTNKAVLPSGLGKT